MCNFSLWLGANSLSLLSFLDGAEAQDIYSPRASEEAGKLLLLLLLLLDLRNDAISNVGLLPSNRYLVLDVK